MRTFTDNTGRTWTVAINVATVKRVRELKQVNLMEAVTGGLINKLEDDICLFVDVLYCVCKPEADANNISDEQFGSALAGDALEKATDAFLDELIDFFPGAKRKMFRAAFQKQRETEQIAIQKLTERLDRMDMGKLVDAKLKNI